MSKRGMISLEELVHFIPYFLVGVVGFYVLLMLFGVFIVERMSVPQHDMIRIDNNLNSLGPGESISVFTKGQNYKVVLYPKGSPEPSCSNDACICVQEAQQNTFVTTKCEIIENVDCTKAQANPGFLCINSKTEKSILNLDEKQKEYITISRASTGGQIILDKKVVQV